MHEAIAEYNSCSNPHKDLCLALECIQEAHSLYDPEGMPIRYQAASEALDRIRAKLAALR